MHNTSLFVKAKDPDSIRVESSDPDVLRVTETASFDWCVDEDTTPFVKKRLELEALGPGKVQLRVRVRGKEVDSLSLVVGTPTGLSVILDGMLDADASPDASVDSNDDGG